MFIERIYDMGNKFIIEIASTEHLKFVEEIAGMIAAAAEEKDSGLALRNPAYLAEKINEEKAIIAFCGEELAAFCYIELWEGKSFIANSGLIVSPKFRGNGLAKRIKKVAFEYSRCRFPESKIFGLTTNASVMRINADLGYRPVSYTDLTTDEKFWSGCSSCSNYDILLRTGRKRCLCTAMLFNPNDLKHKDEYSTKEEIIVEEVSYE